MSSRRIARYWVVVTTTWLVTLIALFAPRTAEACGGCFHTPVNQTRDTQVTAHRMLLSVSQSQTTLWDQIEYVGEASDFAWVLPIKGPVDVGVSSDALFTFLENQTSVEIKSPTAYCPTPTGSVGAGNGNGSGCYSGTSASTKAATSATGGGMSPTSDTETVQVLQQQAVGPYDTVQLASTDPNALRDWLTTHGYVIPADVSPIIDTYVAEGFDFLAVRLAPGMGVQAMQPIRVTTPGASFSLPLRMVAAGTGAKTALTLWVLGEGPYEPMGPSVFTIAAAQLVWDWYAKRSNYSELRSTGLAQNGGNTWLVASASGISATSFNSVVLQTTNDPAGSGYAGADPVAEAQADIDAALHDIPPQTLSFTRLYAELPRAALASDLTLKPFVGSVPRVLEATKTVGNPCAAMTFACDGYGGDGGAASDGNGFDGGPSGSGCTVGDAGSSWQDSALAAFFGLGGAVVLRMVRRRRGHSRS